MAKVLKLATVLLATTLFMGAAQAAEKQNSDFLLEGLVKAALPKSATVEGVVNSGSLGVAIFVLCEIDKSFGGKPDEKSTCSK